MMKRKVNNTIAVFEFALLIQYVKRLTPAKHSLRKRMFLLLLLPLQIFAQDITGLWTGYLQTTGSRVYYELAISESSEKLGGYSLTIFTFDGVDNTGVKSIKIKNKKGKVLLEDGELIYNNYTTPPKKLILSANMSLKQNDSTITLEGTFSTKSLDMRFVDKNEFAGIIYLQKQNTFKQTKLIARLEEMNLLASLSFIPPKIKEKKIVSAPVTISNPMVTPSIPQEKTTTPMVGSKPIIKITKTDAALAIRKTEILSTVYFKSDSLLISVYDNGQIDGDTVSIVLNDKIIISKKGLTAAPLRQTINTASFPGDSLVLVMYAENLGTIPPNTGLLILQDGDARYEIRFSGDLQKSSAVVLKRKRR